MKKSGLTEADIRTKYIIPALVDGGWYNHKQILDNEAVTEAYERSSNDRSIFGIKKMMKEEPKKAKELAETIIKNTYRTLMSRGMKGCYIYCTDEETEEYFRGMV